MNASVRILLKEGDIFTALTTAGLLSNRWLRKKEYKFIQERFLAGDFNLISDVSKAHISDFFSKLDKNDDLPELMSLADVKLFGDLYCQENNLPPIEYE